MKRNLMIVPAALAALSLGASAWAGGSMCSEKSDAKQTMAGSHCVGDASAHGSGQCTIGAQYSVMSFSVPGVECDACVNIVQRAAMSQKGVQCAHVDLKTRTAYVVSEKKLNQRAIAKAIADAGYRCSYKAQGPKVRAELMKAMASGGSVGSHGKDKV